MPEPEELQAHLSQRYGIRVQAMLTLDQDVTLLRRSDGPNWVARVFSAERSPAAAEGDAEILRWLATTGFPAERCAHEEPVSILDGRAVLVTEAVRSVPLAQRRKTLKDAGGLRRLGGLLAALSKLDPPSGAARRSGGAWHHATDGTPAAELALVGEWLEEAEAEASARDLGVYSSLQEELDLVDDGQGLPEAFVHPDFVLANVVATPEPGMVVVDWAGAGVGPRLWPLAFLLWAEGAKDPRRAALVLSGYRSEVQLTSEEVDRLAAMMRARPLIFGIWHLRQRNKAAAVVLAEARETQRLAEMLAQRVKERIEE
jgi:Ser/Thr protein kinase RdoA (MazF antagonist)